MKLTPLLKAALPCLAALLSPAIDAAEPARGRVPEWGMGPFVKHAQPVLSPAADSKFRCPVLGREVRWEKHGFTDSTTVANGLVPFKGRWLLYYGAADRCIGLAVFAPPQHNPYFR